MVTVLNEELHACSPLTFVMFTAATRLSVFASYIPSPRFAPLPHPPDTAADNWLIVFAAYTSKRLTEILFAVPGENRFQSLPLNVPSGTVEKWYCASGGMTAGVAVIVLVVVVPPPCSFQPARPSQT